MNGPFLPGTRSSLANLPQSTIPLGQVVQRILGVGRAGVGHNEHCGSPDRPFLESELCLLFHALSVLKVGFVGHQPMETDKLRRESHDLLFQDRRPSAEIGGFGIRNVPDVGAVLREIRRVLRPGGRALILEFSLPENRWVRGLYLMYFRHILTRIGALVSGDRHAYRYLNRSVEEFPRGEAFCAILRDAGFKHVQAHPLTFGVATLYQGDV